MATLSILKNVLEFTGLVVGVPVALPHLLNVNGVAVAPHLGGANASGFTFTATATTVTATRTADAASGDVNCYVEHWHSYEAALPLPGKLAGLTPFFFATGGGGGSAGTVVASNVFTYRPGSAFTGPVIFNDFDDLYAELDAQRTAADGSGIFTIVFDDVDVGGAGSNCNIPAGGTYDMAGVIWQGVRGPCPHNSWQVSVLLLEGAPTQTTVTNLLSIVGLALNSTQSLAAPIQLGLPNAPTLSVQGSTLMCTDGVVGLIQVADGGSLEALEDVYIGTEGGTVINVGAGAAMLLYIRGENFEVEATSIDGGAGSSLLISSAASSALFDPNQTTTTVQSTQRNPIGFYIGSPNGVLTANIGALCTDASTGTNYRNTDGGTTWVAFP